MDDMNIDTLWPMVFDAPLEEKKKISEDIVVRTTLASTRCGRASVT